MKGLVLFIRLNIAALFVVSLLGNAVLGVVNFVFQPIWRATAVTAAVATTKLQSEANERRAVARARAKEKAKARLRRAVTIIPFAGLAGAAAFEYGDYKEWLEQNPEGDVNQYGTEVAQLSGEVANEVLDELPEVVRPDRQKLLDGVDSLLSSMQAYYGDGPE
ncbi:hypothetical protein [Aliiroseovarius sediminis]|uniref:hypothetical protein n=1 Tax=Aliiroseovarius sediminis TaxID=2925839 RepID=UPI001F57F7B8|nr:hypothetical protein [Aliiroseovarius sediminis]MCI2394448.1 hypothetical protein [Aliiroseovarius sediminis]